MIDRLTISLLNVADINGSFDELVRHCTNMNVNILILNETYLTQGRLHTHWQQHHNYAQRPENGTRGFGGISILLNPAFQAHIHLYMQSLLAMCSPSTWTYTLCFSGEVMCKSSKDKLQERHLVLVISQEPCWNLLLFFCRKYLRSFSLCVLALVVYSNSLANCSSRPDI